MTHDYKRNGTIDLFAAMNIATGEVLTGLNKGHTGADVLRFFKQIDAAVPRGLAVHVFLDNLSAHSTPEIKKWLAHRDRRRWHLHFTSTSSLHQRDRPERRDHDLGRTLEHRTQAIHLESHRRTTSSARSNMAEKPSASSIRRRTTNGAAPQPDESCRGRRGLRAPVGWG